MKSLLRTILNNLTHNVISFSDDLVKYIEHMKHTNEIFQGGEPMEIHSIGPFPNYLADTLANIADRTLAIKNVQHVSYCTNFPRHLSATQEKEAVRKPRGSTTQMSRALSHQSTGPDIMRLV